MISGTDVVEIIKSLPYSQAIIRIVGKGWRPRSHSFEIVHDGKVIKIEREEDMAVLHNAIADFLDAEKKNKEENP